MESINAGIIEMQLARILEKHPEWFSHYRDEERKRSSCFVLMCMAYLLDISKEEAAELLTDGGNDAGVDGIHIGEVYEDEFSVTVFQGKYKKRLDGESTFPESGVQKAIQTIELLFNPFRKCDFNAQLKPKVEEIRSLIAEAGVPKVRVVLCNNGKRWNDQAQTWIDEVKKLYPGKVDFVHFNHDSMVKIMQRVQTIDTTLTLSGKYIFEDMSFVRVFTGRIAAEEIAELFNQYGDMLLQRNVRRYLGLRNNQVNQAMAKTLSSDKSDRFYFYNNGITAICDKMDYNAFQKEDLKLHVKNFQIINGGQTCKTIQETLSGQLPGTVGNFSYVLLRLYQLSEESKSFVQDITFATNNQNPVDLLDLHSNDEIQYELAAGFEALGYYYKRQRDSSDSHANAISSQNVAEAVLAVWMRKPHLAKFRQREHFGNLYHDIFDNLNAAQAILAVQILRLVEKRRKSATEESPDYISYASHFLAMMIGKRLVDECRTLVLQITPGRFAELHHTLISKFDSFYTESIEQLSHAIKRCYGNRDVSLQQLSATFRRNDLLEMISDEA